MKIKQRQKSITSEIINIHRTFETYSFRDTFKPSSRITIKMYNFCCLKREIQGKFESYGIQTNTINSYNFAGGVKHTLLGAVNKVALVFIETELPWEEILIVIYNITAPVCPIEN